jgi:hypothetical protein
MGIPTSLRNSITILTHPFYVASHYTDHTGDGA